ncbi:hypothetical protein GCM10010483_58630 [Actinokineospora diospyrosa]
MPAAVVFRFSSSVFATVFLLAGVPLTPGILPHPGHAEGAVVTHGALGV